DFNRTAGFRVDDANEVDVGHSGQESGMMLSEVAHANDGHAKSIAHDVTGPTGSRPTIVMLASFAAAYTVSPSSTSVLPASIDSAVAPATRIASIVANP